MTRSDDKKRVIKVFIASPGGLEIVRRAFKDTVDELNKGFGDGAGIEFKALGWEDTLSPASMTSRPNGVEKPSHGIQVSSQRPPPFGLQPVSCPWSPLDERLHAGDIAPLLQRPQMHPEGAVRHVESLLERGETVGPVHLQGREDPQANGTIHRSIQPVEVNWRHGPPRRS